MPSIGTFRVTIGDTLTPMNTIIRHGNGDPVDLSVGTWTAVMEEEDGDAELAETATGVTVHPTQAVTLDTATGYIKANTHGFQNGDIAVLATTGSLSGSGLAVAIRYHVCSAYVDGFKVELFPGSGAIVLTGAGTGTITAYVVGSAQMDFAAANVDTAGNYRFHFIQTVSAEKKHWPEGDSWYTVIIVARGN